MLEWILTVGAAELAKVGLDQLLKLGQTAAEDYVKDFFKGCLKDGVAAAKPEVAKKAVAGALKAFLLLVTDELEDQDLSKAEIRDRYDPALIQFVQNESVKPILGKAFEKDCSAIDVAGLATIWQQSSLKSKPFPALPTGFDWQRIGSEYLKKVRRIVRESTELRSLLDTELLEDIARNTTRISPGFDVAKYRASLQTSYGALKLHEIDCTDQQYRMKLWNLFVEPTVREAMPPSRYELPIDLQRSFHAEPAELVEENLERYRRDYFEKSPEKVLKVLADSHHAVILGDPGAGKSTLLQYLALTWVESQTSEFFKNSEVSERLPLLIELREYAIAHSNNFLEFLHSGRGVDWQFDQQQLHQHLQDQPTLVMFDGLDEVFDRATQAAIIDDIIRFAGQYPQAQILITSRVVGYNPEKLQQAEFRHFTIQPLDTTEIHEFIDRWYDLAMGSDADKERLKRRLKDAIANSKAIQNLADNPLLLTMMAILNRRQELPRDRAELYDQASRVLLHNWDVDHKRLKLPLDTIGRREKQEMLRLVAYEMQAGEDGLKGNAIDAGRLTQVLTDYLKQQGFSEPREKANLLIDQLRHRNFILCDRGGDIYGFVHRTFLEYFCAVEIVHRFEKQRTLTFEQLRDQVFGQHWQDETWHEVLKLICGAIDPKFAGKLIEFLMRLEVDRSKFLDSLFFALGTKHLKKAGLINLLLAVDCLAEVSHHTDVQSTSTEIFHLLRQEIEKKTDIKLDGEAAFAVCMKIAQYYRDVPKTLLWLQERVQQDEDSRVKRAAAQSIAEYFRDDPQTVLWLQACVQQNNNPDVREAALDSLATYFGDDPQTLTLLQKHAQHDDNPDVREAALSNLATYFGDDPQILPLLQERAQHDDDSGVRQVTVQTIAHYYRTELSILPWLHELIQKSNDYGLRWGALKALIRNFKYEGETLPLLCKCSQYDSSPWVRNLAIEFLYEDYNQVPGAFELFCDVVQKDSFKREDLRQFDSRRIPDNPRKTALDILLDNYTTHPKTLELLRDRATNDPDEQLREWAQEQLKI